MSGFFKDKVVNQNVLPFFFFKMEGDDFFNTPFPPSVSKDNQMREMPRSCARACKMRLQDHFPILVPEGWGVGGRRRDAAWEGGGAEPPGPVSLLWVMMFSLSLLVY